MSRRRPYYYGTNDPAYEDYQEDLAERRARDDGPPVDDFDPNPWFDERN
ncbi:hypothetical protein SEA_SIXAMA_16 [Gordonia phage Sixama]|uniref:Uncharacterized protein n=1 Tax=Gordonia phage Sixama TaxID=2653271 RepID=A0A5Q2F6W3_9CAUD|nr:hypothetical protein PP302_gp016 [Gordonia phage Sixama]QGF20195.1 hypothetical protein SEA_SIXAMA_16 [Gordonia phage Sixama]